MLHAVRHNPTLSTQQMQIISALANGRSIAAVAREFGIHRTTVYHWMKTEPAFLNAYEDAELEFRGQLADHARELANKAFDTIRQILDDEKASPSVRLRAALAVLERKRDWSVSAPLEEADRRGIQAEAVETVESPARNTPEIPRNAACPCGSGAKYKRCCGRHSPAVLGPPKAAPKENISSLFCMTSRPSPV
jgi:transposase-like protein